MFSQWHPSASITGGGKYFASSPYTAAVLCSLSSMLMVEMLLLLQVNMSEKDFTRKKNKTVARTPLYFRKRLWGRKRSCCKKKVLCKGDHFMH